LFTKSEYHAAPLKFLNEMMKDLEADPAGGPNHLNTFMASAYRSIAHMKIASMRSLETGHLRR
jgi:hypothetical protein